MSEVDLQAEVRAFIISRRARAQPTGAELARTSGPRRVAGLRREEAARRASVSLDYYVQLERGQLRGVSDAVLGTLMDALELDAVERSYLTGLVAQMNRASHVQPEVTGTIRPELQSMIDRLTDVAVIVRNLRMDLLGGNARGLALFSSVLHVADHNIARHVFLDPASHALYPDYDAVADSCAGSLRASLGQGLADDDLVALVDELLVSPDFAARWNAHHVQQFGAGVQLFDHPVVGPLALQHEQLRVVVDPGLTMTVYRPAPDPRSEQAFARLGTSSFPTPPAAGVDQAAAEDARPPV